MIVQECPAIKAMQVMGTTAQSETTSIWYLLSLYRNLMFNRLYHDNEHICKPIILPEVPEDATKMLTQDSSIVPRARKYNKVNSM